MTNYKIGYYAKADGERPVLVYIGKKSIEEQGRIDQKKELLKKEGPFLRLPHARKFGKIYELRPKGMRLFYYFSGAVAIFVHAVDKKDFKQEDIKFSEKRRKELEG